MTRPAGTEPRAAAGVGGRAHLPPRAADRPRRRAPLAWLPWAVLGALLLLLLLGLLLSRLGSGPDDTAGSAGRGNAGTAGSSAPTGDGVAPPPGPAPGPPTGAGTPAGSATAPGTLTVGTTDLLGTPAALAGLRDLADQPAVATGTPVQAVVADEGFWVGADERNRVYVVLSPAARQAAGESPFQVSAGQRIDLTARVTALAGPADLGVTPAEGAEQLATQGAYLLADTVKLSS